MLTNSQYYNILYIAIVYGNDFINIIILVWNFAEWSCKPIYIYIYIYIHTRVYHTVVD